jgi:adenosylhomocysteine nucleosidase
MTDTRVTKLIEQAFDYRGYVTISRRDGSKLVGFVYDRSPAHVEMFDEKASNRIRLAMDDIADVELTGEDVAAKAQQIWERRKGSLEPPETPAWGEWEAERPVLLLVALPRELRGVARVLGSKIRGAIVRGRLGDASAVGFAVGMGGGAAQAIATERPRLVISCGFSGALAPSLASGDLVLASSVREDGGESIAVAKPLLRAARQALGEAQETAPAEGEILCTTRVAATRDEKRALARPGRLAVDLESWPAARAAEQAGIPWLAIRVVLDRLDADLPPFTRTAHGNYVAPALRYALEGPRAVIELARLGLRARTASRSLERALRRLASSLGTLGRPEPHQ